ncbi:MAG: nucleotidyltransferase domain-containing protein [Candidatus Gastranaerophilales bacterium]|nr:nucleotidyltransferase domain-containing protein [Candidatus Gastranaerophilales bacterium]
MDNFGLPERTMNELLDYFKSKPEIEKVVIYGSRAKGTYRTASDIDFAIWSDKENLIGIPSELDELPTPYMFDVINYKDLSDEPIKSSIDRDGKLFYQRD